MRPCVALLHAVDPVTGETTDPEETLIPRLDAREVAAVFTAPFAQFLRATDDPRWGSDNPTEWYQGAWTEWHRENWRSMFSLFFFFYLVSLLPMGLRYTSKPRLTRAVHQFFVPIDPKTVVKPRSSNQAQQEAASALEEKERSGAVTRYRVFGMTARILVDVARLAYAREPEFEHNSHFGDERLIAQLREMGRLSPARKRGDELTREDLEMASQVGMRSEKSKLS